MNAEQILSAYRGSDLDLRLRLFLTYRDLRDQFNAIEDENNSESGLFVSSNKKSRFFAW